MFLRSVIEKVLSAQSRQCYDSAPQAHHLAYFPEAPSIAEFVYEAYDREDDIICQCEYGQSRSAGTAAAILEHFENRGITIFTDYKYYPNQVLYHKIFDELEKIKTLRSSGCSTKNEK